MRFTLFVPLVLSLSSIAPAFAGPAPDILPVPGVLDTNPLARTDVVLEGAALARLAWNEDPPAFAGDRPGSLTALYDANLEPGRIGWAVSEPFTAKDPFHAAALFVIDPEGFSAPGLFQISWGLWNTRTTGFNRTGTPESFFGDTFDLIEWDYFPGRVFGGPFYSPSVFGAAHTASPLFDLLGAFANASFDFRLAALPLGVPLLATIEHLPAEGVAVFRTFRIGGQGAIQPIPGAAASVPLGLLPLRDYVVDTFGLTLWKDGFGGETPTLRARVHFHGLSARPGRLVLPQGTTP